MLRIAHRGASGYEPENTLISFRKALELGADGAEFDVHLSKDGKVVVIHDSLVNRTTNGKGFVSRKTLQELQELDAGNGEKIPTLQEVLDLIKKKMQVHIELKGKNTASPVAAIIEEYVKRKKWEYSDFFVSSFNHAELSAFKKLLPQVKIGALIIGIKIQLDTYKKKLDAYSVNMLYKFARKSVIEEAHEKGLKVFVYTVNNVREMKRMKELGVDGIFTNYPDRMR